MNHLATFGDLTGLFNRRAFFHACEIVHKLAERNRQGYCVLAIDLDYFKKLNDRNGHAGGDKVLAEFGVLLLKISRESDISGRLGGEEFAFFLPNTSIEQAQIFAEKLREEINKLVISHQEQQINITASIGISSNVSEQNVSVDNVLIQADEALYRAKHSGRDKIVVHQGMSEKSTLVVE